jgi:hypothetical protein
MCTSKIILRRRHFRKRRRDYVECGGLLPPSSPKRIAVPRPRRGAACCARCRAANQPQSLADPGPARYISLSRSPPTRPRKRRQVAALQIKRRRDSVECGSLLPLSSPKRIAVPRPRRGAACCARCRAANQPQFLADPGPARCISLSRSPPTRPRKRRQAAALQIKRRRDSVECGSLLPLSSPKRIAVARSRRGAACCARCSAAHHAQHASRSLTHLRHAS